MEKRKWIKRITLFVVSAVIAAGLTFHGLLNGWFVRTLSPKEVSAIIEPHLRIFRPAGDAPVKTVLMFHGCGGDQQQQQYWGETIQQWGYAAVIVDSYSGRGIGQERATKKVCRGRELLGNQRAADVLAAITWANRQTWTAKQDIVLMGWSHGAWSIMEAYAQQAANELPVGLSARFASGLESVNQVAVVYPYCGIASSTSASGWRLQPNVLAIDVAQDTVVGTQACLASYDRITQSGASVQQHVLGGVDHAFDVDAVSQRVGRTVRSGKDAALHALEQSKAIVKRFLDQPSR